MATKDKQDSALPPSAPPGFSDHTFTPPSGVELAVRVWPAETPISEPAPFIIWTHGGGWFGGFHFAPLPWMAPGFRQRGYHFVSHNYRLAPQAGVEEQLEDTLAAISWCRANLPSILGENQVDVDRYVLTGESAGGHLATLAGLHVPSPSPKAIVNMYGVVDFVSMSAFGPPEKRATRATQPPWDGRFSEETLAKLLRDRDQANAVTDALPWDEFKRIPDTVISKLWATDFKYTERALIQAELHIRYALSASAEGLRVGILHGERFQSEEELIAFVRSVSPLRVLQHRAAEGKKGADLFPPTAFLHGTGDVDVPVEQSYAMASVLKDAGVPVVESYEEGEPHVFDLKYTGPDVPGWDTYIVPILDFIDEHLSKK
ncbi:putative isoprenylcysteine alpha-carbonyl methylesterase ICMEL2 [Dichotomopilus funicola]|uniref:Isoprenylcysteine alpha-carbonyl methylesterase ICMEL2 n=1 Tax=Dichotomopilus funicola TaxID=1934379 RepID=A0AAN6ZHC8_9PEZI|nr:putative isoprenylcysteine alpha-carbonyl methylesterase ICMEL2 [Dichotomopilus funicola]